MSLAQEPETGTWSAKAQKSVLIDKRHMTLFPQARVTYCQPLPQWTRSSLVRGALLSPNAEKNSYTVLLVGVCVS